MANKKGNMNVVFITIVIFTLLNGLNAQRPSFGKCPDLGKGKTVELDKIKGRWYEVERTFYMYELNRRCISMDFTPQGKDLQVDTKALNRVTNGVVTESAIAKSFKPGSASFRLLVKSGISDRLPTALQRVMPGSGNYVLLDTDYDTYAVVYSCSNLASIMHADLIWVLSRTRDIPVLATIKIYSFLERLGLNSGHLTLTPQDNCPKNM